MHYNKSIFHLFIVASFMFAGLAYGQEPLLFTFGCIRMGSSEMESANVLAGYLATIRYVNTHNLVPGVQFRLNVTTIPCQNSTACRKVTMANPYVMAFKAAMPGFSAILRPNFMLANGIVDYATQLGGIPVLDPEDVRMTSFGPGYDNIIHFNQNWGRQLDHLFTYMMQTGRCAHSGIVHTAVQDSLEHVPTVKSLFAAGGYPVPPNADVSTLSDTDFLAFFGAPNRNCFVIIGSNFFMNNITKRLISLNFDPNSVSFYGVATLAGDQFAINGSSAMYATLHYLYWMPAIPAGTITKAFAEWAPNRLEYEHFFEDGNGETIPTAVVPFTRVGYLQTMYLIANIRAALAVEEAPNRTGPLPLTWDRIVSAFYQESRTVEDYTFAQLVRACPRLPRKQICFCNVATRLSHLRMVNLTTGLAVSMFDDLSKGQRDIASIEFPSSCGYFASAWSYPITGLALYPSYLMQTGQQRTDAEQAYALYQDIFGLSTYNVNYAATAPTRALRYAPYDISNDSLVNSYLDMYIDTLKPFVVYGTMTGEISDPKGVLTLHKSMMATYMEDPPLVPHSEWRWDIVHLQPVMADYIHAIANYYSASSFIYTSLHAIASNTREAELISMSFATVGFDVPVSSVIVTADPLRWASLVSVWLRASSNPFVIAASINNTNLEVESLCSAAAPIGKGVVAIAAAVGTIYNSLEASFNSNGEGDIIFGAFRREWWTPEAVALVPDNLQKYAYSPRYYHALLSLDIAKSLYQQVYYDYSATAAEVLYSSSVVSASETSFGPFSNATCTVKQIAENDPDRSCQCTKGLRTVFMLSMRSYAARSIANSTTNSYSWTMTTCGVVYTPYVPESHDPHHEDGLSAGAIAGIAVGATAAFLLLIVAFVFNTVCLGRNNRAAPKDSSLPFAIVFTDIQSSTALWARAPAAMSEAVDLHHELMRKSLRRHSGYEVKTVGDSFMVAFKDPVDAASFALDIQTLLHTASWSHDIDATYLELIAEAEEAAVAATIGDGDTSGTHSNNGGSRIYLMNPANALGTSTSDTQRSHTESDQTTGRLKSRSEQRVPSEYTDVHAPSAHITHSRTPKRSLVHSELGLSEAPMRGGDREDGNAAVVVGSPWNGLRVRIGVHYGLGDIRKDPVSQGYDYYGTVVNVAARVEGVGHGGQTLLTSALFDALPSGFATRNHAVLISLGPQPLRGLDSAIQLYQMVPTALQTRVFPVLRLHIEKETEESSVTETNTNTTNTTETPEVIISRICSSKQFASVSAEELLDRYNYFTATFGATSDKYKASVIAKLGESWGFEKAAKMVHAGGVGRTRLLVSVVAKVTKAYLTTHHHTAPENNKGMRKFGHNAQSHHETMSDAIKSLHLTEISSMSDGK